MSPSSSEFPQPSREPTPVEREALDWLARRDRGLSAAEGVRLQEWLGTDPRRALLLAEFDGTWRLLNRMAEIPGHTEGGNAEQPGIGATTPAVRRSRGNRAGWGRPLVLAATIVLAAGLVLWRFTPPATRGAGPESGDRFETEVGAWRRLILADGSTLQLNTDSAVMVWFSPAERRVRLVRGEAHFAVAREAGRPFVVAVAGVDVRAVGTAFNVRMRSEAVEVLVTAGRVRVDATAAESAGESPAVGGLAVPGAAAEREWRSAGGSAGSSALPELTAGQKMVVTLPTTGQAAPTVAIAPLPAVEIERTLAWQDRRLEFESSPLAEMVAEFNRYHRHKLVLTDAGLGRQRFGGTFRADDPAAFVRMLEIHFGVVVERRPGETVLRPAVP